MTESGETTTAGEGISDDEMVKGVAGETSPDLKAEDVFEREADGTDTDEPVSEESADDLE